MSANLPVDFDATSTTVSGCEPLTGETGLGALAFSVEPSAAAPPEMSSVDVGEAGLGDDFEHATASANRAAAAHRRNLFWCIRQTSIFSGARWDGRENARFYYRITELSAGLACYHLRQFARPSRPKVVDRR